MMNSPELYRVVFKFHVNPRSGQSHRILSTCPSIQQNIIHVT